MYVISEHDDRSPPEWPQDLLDVEALVRDGWQPRPFRQFIVKVNSRCNLACAYCYVYRSPDQSWRDQPVRMSPDTVVQVARRIGEHADAHGLPRVEVVLHGGEPLLAGPEFVDFFCRTVRAAAPRDAEIHLYVQTNGTLLDDRLLTVLLQHRVRVGISLDGDAATQDAHRSWANGRGSYAAVAKALGQLRTTPYRDLYAGLLCVVDPGTDPIPTYERLLDHEPPAVDLLLPHANWSNPPSPGPGGSPTPHGDWLIAVFDRWYSATERETSVRLFEELINGLLGGSSRVESVGLSPACLVVVETDGSIEQSDALKSAYDGAAHTGLNVHQDPFDAALLLPPIVARQIGTRALSEACGRCDLHPVCGGGFYPHRYRAGSGFLNPSVYCADLAALIRHVRARLQTDVAALRTDQVRVR